MGLRRAVRLVAVGGVTIIAGYVLFRVAARGTPAQVGAGAAAPNFTAVTLDAARRPRSLADYRGSPLLLNVWATWCDPCREEMPSMERLYETFKDRGLRIVAISIDDRGSEPLIREFAAEHRLSFDILPDPSSAIMQSYHVRGVPQSFLISAAGQLVAVCHHGLSVISTASSG